MAKLRTREGSIKNENQRITEAQLGAFEQAIMRWYAPEFPHHQRGWLWYVIAGLFNASFIAYAAWSGSWTMLAVFIVLPAVFLISQRKKPTAVEVVISPYGVKFGALRIPYSNIKSFWIFHEPPQTDELHLLTNNKLNPEITIPLMGSNATTLRQYLITQVPEWEGKKQSLVDILVHFLKLA